MDSLIVISVIGCCLSLIFTPLVRRAAHAVGLVDVPDSRRKVHQKPVPRLGGVAVGVSYFCVFALLAWTVQGKDGAVWSGLPLAAKLLPAAAVMFVTGLLDDLFHLAPWQKLSGQVVAAVLAYVSGLEIQAWQFGCTPHWWWSLPLTVGWLVLCANAVNLIDGLDGLATGVGFLASATAVAAALMQHNFMLAVAAAPLAGALLGFLRYNRNPATIFLGDSGSLLIGFLLGCYGVSWSGRATTPLNMAAPVMVLAIPLLDTALAIVRRFLRKHPIFEADRGHIHHRLLDRGMTVRRTALALYGCCGVSMLLSLVMLQGRYQLAAAVTFGALVLLGIRFLGYAELRMVARMVFDDSFRSTLRSRVLLEQLGSSLALARKPEECWNILKDGYREFGFCEVRMRLAGETYAEKAEVLRSSECWNLAIPISDRDYVELSCGFSARAKQEVVALFPEIIRGTIGAKLPGFETQAAETPAVAARIHIVKTVTAR